MHRCMYTNFPILVVDSQNLLESCGFPDFFLDHCKRRVFSETGCSVMSMWLSAVLIILGTTSTILWEVSGIAIHRHATLTLAAAHAHRGFMEGIKVDFFLQTTSSVRYTSLQPPKKLYKKNSAPRSLHTSWMSSLCWLSSLPCVQLLLPTQTSWSLQGLCGRPMLPKTVTPSCGTVHGLTEKTTTSLYALVSYLCVYICSVAHLVKHIDNLPSQFSRLGTQGPASLFLFVCVLCCCLCLCVIVGVLSFLSDILL